MNPQLIAAVALGGAIGSVLRYLSYQVVPAPWGTLAINVLGSFAIGVLFVVLAGKSHLAPLLMTGVLGGFTTFSAFSLDTLMLWERGQPGPALVYVILSVAASLLAVFAGLALGRSILA